MSTFPFHFFNIQYIQQQLLIHGLHSFIGWTRSWVPLGDRSFQADLIWQQTEMPLRREGSRPRGKSSKGGRILLSFTCLLEGRRWPRLNEDEHEPWGEGARGPWAAARGWEPAEVVEGSSHAPPLGPPDPENDQPLLPLHPWPLPLFPGLSSARQPGSPRPRDLAPSASFSHPLQGCRPAQGVPAKPSSGRGPRPRPLRPRPSPSCNAPAAPPPAKRWGGGGLARPSGSALEAQSPSLPPPFCPPP